MEMEYTSGESPKLDPLDFFKKYELLSSSKDYTNAIIKSKVCRYCGRAEPKTTFKQETHLIPELLGRNNFITYDECDICNKLFGGYESNLAKFFNPYITLLGVKGKRMVPDFQSRSVDRKEETRTFLKHNEGNRKHLIVQDSTDYSINKKEKTFEIAFRLPPITLVNVYKSLLKIGLSLLPRNLDKYNQNSFKWLTNQTESIDYIPYAFTTTLNKNYFASPSANLYQAKKLRIADTEFVEHILVICFANQVVQIILPFSDRQQDAHIKGNHLEINLFPPYAFAKLAPQTLKISAFDLRATNTLLLTNRMEFSYGDINVNVQPEQTKRD
jgi:hypothetical protein